MYDRFVWVIVVSLKYNYIKLYTYVTRINFTLENVKYIHKIWKDFCHYTYELINNTFYDDYLPLDNTENWAKRLVFPAWKNEASIYYHRKCSYVMIFSNNFWQLVLLMLISDIMW